MTQENSKFITFRRLGGILFLIILLLPTNKVFAKTDDTNIVNYVYSNIVNFTTDTIIKIDKFRVTTSVILQKIQSETQNNVDVLNKSSAKNKDENNTNQKFSEDVKLFFFIVLSTIFKYQILFYGILVTITFFLIRYIWGLIF